jgi:hypothetical protein
MTIAHKIVENTVPSLKIKEEREQTTLEEFIAKISLILHNLFTKGQLHIDLDDDDVANDVAKVVLEISMELMGAIEEYQRNGSKNILPKRVVLKIINIDLDVVIKINDHALKIEVQEYRRHFWFPQSELLFDINLKHPNTINKYSTAVNKLSDKITGMSYSKLRFINSIVQYSQGELINTGAGDYLRKYFMYYAAGHFKQKPSERLSALLDKYTNNPNADYAYVDNMNMYLFFIYHCNDNDQETVNLKQILRAVQEIDIPTDADIYSYCRVFGLNSSQTSCLRDIVKAVKEVKLRRKNQKSNKKG